jgi:hypothetical protein
MTAHQTTRRAILAGASSVPLAVTVGAVAAPMIVSSAPTVDAVSFPALVDQFVRIRERRNAKRALDQMWGDKIDKLFYEATGLDWDALDWQNPGFQQLEAVRRRIVHENPDDSDVDEEGVDNEWNEILDELWPLAEAMINQTPQSAVDLAWQAEALTTADCELLEIPADDYPADRLLRKLLNNVRAFSGELPSAGTT